MVRKHLIFKYFASLKLAVLLLLVLSGVLTAGTVFESLYGMRGAHVLVYGAPWFFGLLFLLGTNVLCAALSRYPWKRHQTGFVITHTGILTILLGSFLTQRLGVDGNLPVYEGSQDNEAILSDLVLMVVDEKSGTHQQYAVPESHISKQGTILTVDLGGDERLEVDAFVPRAVVEKQITGSPIAGLGNPAIQFELFNERFRIDEWLMSQSPNKETELNLGPAIVSFRTLWSAAEEADFLKSDNLKRKSKAPGHGYLTAELQGHQYRVEIDDSVGKWRPLGSLQVKIDRYLPYAIVEDDKLINKSNEPVNPAVDISLRDPLGTEEKHTVFANFPEFATLHKAHVKGPRESFGVKFRMISGKVENQELAGVGKNRGRLSFAQSVDGKRLYYRIQSALHENNRRGVVEIGKVSETGWMDLHFRVKQWIAFGVEQYVPKPVDYISGGDTNFQSALHAVLQSNRLRRPTSIDSQWLVEGYPQHFVTQNHKWKVALQKTKQILPFHIHLDKFTVGTDPGTTKAATYESQVTVRDPIQGVEKKALISMNEPLLHGGFTFYQASYSLQEGRPPVSIFAVNYDPGRPIKYLGSLLLVLGIIVMFYMNPHYWGVLLGRRKEAA